VLIKSFYPLPIRSPDHALELLPSGSPELQPAERLWPLTNEAVANRLFEEIEEVEEALVERCVELLDQTEVIRSLANYHWWPQAA
jgi:transposase